MYRLILPVVSILVIVAFCRGAEADDTNLDPSVLPPAQKDQKVNNIHIVVPGFEDQLSHPNTHEEQYDPAKQQFVRPPTAVDKEVAPQLTFDPSTAHELNQFDNSTPDKPFFKSDGSTSQPAAPAAADATKPTATTDTKPTHDTSAPCQAAYSAAHDACHPSGIGAQLQNMVVGGLGNALTSLGTSSSSFCDAQAKLGDLLAGTSTSRGSACAVAVYGTPGGVGGVGGCRGTCKQDSVEYTECGSLMEAAGISTGLSAMQGAQSNQLAKQCADYFKNRNPTAGAGTNGCNGAKAAQNPACLQQYCTVDANKNSANCVTYLCSQDIVKAKTNPLCPQYCTNPDNVNTKQCGGQIATQSPPGASTVANGGGGPGGAELAPTNLDPGGASPLYNGNPKTDDKNTGNTEANDQAAAGAPFANNPYPGGKDNPQGKGGGANGLNPDIEKGFYGGGFSAQGVPTQGGGGGPFARDANGNLLNKLDLSKYLPGGALDPKRDLASNSLRSMGITGANELSNFEKITRMMNRKRPFLKSGEGI